MSKYNLPKIGRPKNRLRKLDNGEIECRFYQGVTVVTVYDKNDVCILEKKFYDWEQALDFYKSY